MFYIRDQYAKVWSVDRTGKFPKARISTSEKGADGKYDKAKTSNWFATFFSDAKDKAEDLDGTERIKILKGKITNIGKKQNDNTWKNYLNVIIFDFEVIGGSSSRNDRIDEEPSIEDGEEDPF